MAEQPGQPRLRGWGYELLIGCYLLPLALLPWASTEPPKWGVLTTLAGGLILALLAWRAKPHRPHRHDGSSGANPLLGVELIRLSSGSSAAVPTRDACYVALAQLDDGTERVICQACSPAPALAAALSLQGRSGARLVPGWGLEPAELARLGSRSTSPITLAASRHVGATRAGGRAGAVSLLVSAAALSMLVGGFAVFGDTQLTPSSLALWGLGVLLLSLIAVMCVTSVTTVTLGDTVCLERRLCGLLLSRRVVPTASISVLRLLGPDGSFGQHLLLAGHGLLIDWECGAELGRRVEEVFRKHIEQSAGK